MWKKLKWWHWALIVMLVAGLSNVIIEGPGPRATKPTFARPNAKFALIAGDSIFTMTFDEQIDPSALPDLARDQCGKNPRCQVLGWTDPKFAARGFPMTDREVGALAFSYALNRDTGFEQTLWNCKRWARRAHEECLR